MPPPATSFPWLGLTAVLMGTFISTLNTRLSTLGLADIRGAVHAGFDEGAWISTSQTVAQMLVTLVAIWLGAIYGTRKVSDGSGCGVCRHLDPRAFLPQPADPVGIPISGGHGLRLLHSTDAELRAAKHAAQGLGVWNRDLRSQPRSLPEHLRLAGRLVYGLSVVALDLSGRTSPSR